MDLTTNLDVAGNGGRVLIGKYPVATLGLSNDYMKDVHGNYLIYAVTQAATTSLTVFKRGHYC